MIYVKSHYNRLDKMYFGKKVCYDYKNKISKLLTIYIKNCKIRLLPIEKRYIKQNLIMLFTIYRYFSVKLSEIYRLILQLLNVYFKENSKNFAEKLIKVVLTH